MFSIFLMLLIILSVLIISQGLKPVNKVKKESTKIAREVADIQKVDEFYWFNREKNYYTVVGRDSKNQEKVVFIPQDGSEALIMDWSAGITEDEVIQLMLDVKEVKRLRKLTLGVYKGNPVWEVVATNQHNQIDYYLLDFETGKIEQTLKNV